MGLRILQKLAAEPNPTSVPGNVVLTFRLAAEPRMKVEVAYEIAESWDVYFSTTSGPRKRIEQSLEATPGGAPVRTPVHLVRGAGTAPPTFRIAATVRGQGSGQAVQTACAVIPRY